MRKLSTSCRPVSFDVSDTFVYCIQKATDIIFLSQVAASFYFLKAIRCYHNSKGNPLSGGR